MSLPRTAATILGLSTAVAFIGSSVVLPGTAAARCAGSTSVRSSLVIDQNGGKVEVAAEKPVSGTCNGNNVYQGTAVSQWPSWRPTVWISEYPGAEWVAHRGSYDNPSFTYTHHDSDKNSSSRMILCIDKDGLDICGWGNDWGWSDEGAIYNGAFGHNHGY
ncbi:hypothetical protein [Saccharothrix sp. HUAS TT1]|uniref:hypothetical protein n=1 Tax=unclassified Saccharothrix TaxID=2593673 RepID=UPI00345BD26E